MAGRSWTDGEDALLARLAVDLTSAQIAEALGRSMEAVKHRSRGKRISLKKLGEKCSWSKYSDEDSELARQLHESGMGPRRISEKLGVPYWSVCDMVYFKRLG